MTLSSVIDVMEEFNRLLAKRESQQWVLMGNRWVQLQNSLALYIQQLADEVAARKLSGLPVNRTAIYKLDRYKDLLTQVAGEAKRYETFANGIIQSEQLAYGTLGIEAASAAIRTAGYSAAFNKINPSAIQNMVGITGDGSPLFDVLMKRAIAPEMVSGMTNKLIEAVSLGYNPVKTARLMASGLTNGLTKALTIARTEQIRVYRQANLTQYEESGIVQEWIRHCALSERTCLECLALDGQIQKTGTLFASHPNCRCYTEPVIDGIEPGERTTGSAWLAKKPVEFQQKVLGGYFDMYQKGTPLEKMVNVIDDPTWGPTLRTVPLKDLVAD